MKCRLFFVVLVLSIILGFSGLGYASGKTLYVPKDFATLQEAINAAEDGDTIEVAEGTYKGNINFKGKSLTLTSDSANTIIEGTETGSVVTIDTNSILKGFTITSGNVDCRGIYIIEASPTIENCTVMGNKTTEKGSGILSTANSSPQIINCVIIENGSVDNIEQVVGGTLNITDSYIGERGFVATSSSEPAIISEEPTEQITTAISEEVATANTSEELTDQMIRPTRLNGEILTINGLETTGEGATGEGLWVIDLATGDITAQDLAELLVGNLPCVTISNASYTGDQQALGIFYGGGTNPAEEVGIESGVVLGTGQVKGVNGSAEPSTWYGLPGDSELAAIVPIDVSYTSDAAVLEFDFTADTDIIMLQYVFSSIEYPEYVGQYNDLFGCFVNGIQRALLPDDLTYIGVGTINDHTNAMFYRNNNFSPRPIDCKMDGLTTVLTLQAPINPAPAVNHIKVVIADLNDCNLDSNVFIASLYSSPPVSYIDAWYVDDNAPAGGNGQSWETAFRYLQDAIDAASVGEGICVARGTYKPDQAETITIEAGDHTAAFQLKNGVA
ncbi:MAG: choice-of-anchor L domain-containing protein, partial [Candidatus Ratteibacteria bacterium]|nr:choice-of-anchor L domain-containing protein [Candidatus Ratteibacteria bacterium]